MTQFLRPASDVSTGGWTATPLFEKLDETVADDVDFIESANGPTDPGDPCVIGLDSGGDPQSSTDHVLRVRIKKNSGGGAAVVGAVLALKQGTTTIASAEHLDEGAQQWSTKELTLTGTEADSITDYTDLRVEITALQTTGASRRMQVSWAEFECPDAVGGGAAEVLEGTADAAASATGSLKRTRTVSSVALAASSAQASLNRKRAVAGVASAASSTSGDLTVQAGGATVELAGSASAASSANGILRASAPISGIAGAASSSTGDLSVAAGIIVLEGTASAAASASGLLSRTIPLRGIISGASQAGGSLDTAAAVYIFRTPTFPVAHGKGPLWGRVTFERGYSVLKTADGTYELRTGTRADEIEAASAFYQGGREHHVTQSEKDDLEAAGFEVETV